MQPVKLGARLWSYVTAGLLGLMVAGACTYAQAVLGTPEQTNDRIKALSATARSQPHDYIIGSGDTIVVDVFDVKELSREVRVSQTGTIGLPLVPVRMKVEGLTETQAQRKIAEVLEGAGLVTHPEVTVTVKDRKSKPITVVGAVGHQMVYQADHPVTLLEVLAEAGGVAADAGDTAVVTRPNIHRSDESDTAIGNNEDVIPPSGQQEPPPNPASVSKATQPLTSVPPSTPAPDKREIFPSANNSNSGPNANEIPPAVAVPPALANTITVNLNELMESGDATNNIMLQAGDIVTVPHAGIVYVLGAIGKPGGYVLANDHTHMTCLKMLALAGGANHTAKADHAVIVRRDHQGQQHEQTVDLKKILERKTEDVRLEANDILYVPDSNVKKALYKASELAVAVGTGVLLYRVAY